MKKYIFLAASALTLASCTSEDFLGNTPGSTPTSANSAIKFDGNAGKISRATSNEGTPQQMLDGQFLVYGVKKVADNKYSDVFKDYSIWYNTNHTTSNTNNWEYVGQKDNSITPNPGTTVNLEKDQTIKYWDYASDNYHFVAGSPIANFTYVTNDNGNIESATVSGLGGHITANSGTTATTFNPVYVAKPKVVAKANYQKPVQFEFVRQQSMVRVGIYETIPGYSITHIKFYAYDTDGYFKVSEGNNIILTSATDGYFVGGSNLTGTVTYDWKSTTPSYTYAYNETGLTKSKNWYAGALTNGVQAISSAETAIDKLYGIDGDMAANNGYFIVMPTLASEASPILIKCDYTLKSTDGSNEEIHVKGATAAIPAAYSKWDINTRYTYLFKISENTNGYTGTDPDKTGLYPITFDAAVKDTELGTVTTFTTPSITTYQVGSVTDNGIEYKSGTPITVKVTNPTDGTDLALNETDNTKGKVAVYKLSQERTEADLQLASVSTEEIKSTNSKDVTLATDKKSFTFTPDVEGYYAIQYLTTAATEGTQAAYTYKVVYVAAN